MAATTNFSVRVDSDIKKQREALHDEQTLRCYLDKSIQERLQVGVKRHLDIELLDDIIRKLARGEQLPEKNKDHALTG
ncbi:MAG: hypothetical protein Q4A78_10685 [Peptostreptococcaceae bacterium]|nr:hypothetical protein [Peptostreptococcaceae bacterium]